MGGGMVLVHKEQREAASASSPSRLPAPPPGMAAVAQGRNPLAMARDWVTEQQDRFQVWLAQQPTAVEAAIITGLSAAQGGLLGGLISSLGKDLQSEAAKNNAAKGLLDSSHQANPFLSPEGMVGGPLVQARNFAVLTGANAGISCVLKRIRGVDDVQNSMAAAFGSGLLFSLVSGPGRLNVASAVGTGAFFAVIQGGFHKLGQMMTIGTPRSNEDVYYARARSMLMKLGLARYEKNFRKGLLTDVTLPLLTDSALREVGIPPGPRLVILDQVQRDPELMKGRR